MTRKQAIALRHVCFEHLGSIDAVLGDRGFDVRYLEAGVDDLAMMREPPDLLVVLGGPIGAYEEAVYPCLSDELRLIEAQLAAGKPLLGICLGAQLIARALGVRVYPGPAKEIGWAPLRPTEEGRGSVLAPLADTDWHVLHWHGDVFELPVGAVRLASTEIAENQAFALGANVLGLQFHIEALAVEIEHWLIGHTIEIAAAPGVEVADLRRDTARWGPGLEKAGRRCFELWMDALGG
ncbi:MAG: glutamine amidotransferase [Methyloligellaceae bacterium]